MTLLVERPITCTFLLLLIAGSMWMGASTLQTWMKDIMRAGALTNVMLAQD